MIDGIDVSAYAEMERKKIAKRFAGLAYTSFLGKKHKEKTKKQMSEAKWSFPKEKRLEIAKRYKNGEKQIDIARELGVSRSVITRCVAEFGFQKLGKAQKISDHKIGQLYFIHKKSMNKIALEYGMSSGTVWRAIQREKEKRFSK